ncbi:MAG: UMP kinase [Bacilli bacterium]|jgi:uridylate kinase
MAIYRRIILKLSGAALGDSETNRILQAQKLKEVALAIKTIVEQKVEVGVVVGAGNIWRGKLAQEIGLEPATADYMGIIGTIINSLALANTLNKLAIPTRVLSALEVKNVVEPYKKKKALAHLQKGQVVIFAGGTGKPFFTTDTCAALRAKEMKAEAILMAKNGVDGVYTADPNTNKNAKFLKRLTFAEVLRDELKVMDATTISLLEDTDIKIHVFAMDDPENFKRVLQGEEVGTIITKGA